MNSTIHFDTTSIPAQKIFVSSEAERIEKRNQLIKEVAFASLKELAVSLAFAGVACCFVPTPLSVAMLLTSSIAIVLFNTCIRAASAGLAYRLFLLNDNHSVEAMNEKHTLSTIIKFTNFLCPMSFSILDLATRDTLTHEAGHALAALALYKNPRPSITIEPFVGGVTKFFPSQLNELGAKLGSKASEVIVAGAGPGLSLIFSIAGLVLGHSLRKKHPEINRYLVAMAITSIANHVIYALSAFWVSAANGGHDFLRLWANGIHPAVGIVCMVALPILVKSGMFLTEFLWEKYTTPTYLPNPAIV